MQKVSLTLKTEIVIFENVILGLMFYDKQNYEKLEYIC